MNISDFWRTDQRMDGPSPATLDQTQEGWYLGLMAPATKLQPFRGWLDPTRLYMFPEGFRACLDDLQKQIPGDSFDEVVGIDAMGFVLASALADRFCKGLQIIRKAGKIPVNCSTIKYKDYELITKELEIRKNPFPPGCRVLVVDQWIESGGTMEAAIKLIERNQGVVSGVAVICIEGTEGGRSIQEKYRCYHCATKAIQEQLNKQHLESFHLYGQMD